MNIESRRRFIQNIALSLAGLVLSPRAFAAEMVRREFKGKDVFDRIVARAHSEHWSKLPIGELMGKIAKELEGTPYVGGTLEVSPDFEVCKVDMHGLDCVTFFETTLDFARMLKKGGHTTADLLAEVGYTRYRGGTPGDYPTRLHYTSDWFVDNEAKGVIKILSQLPGAEPFQQKVGFMTSHQSSYLPLATHNEYVTRMKEIEKTINGRALVYYPLDKIAAVEPHLQTGDIVGVCTKHEGLDIAHTGIIYRDAGGVPHFMDASSKKSRMKVTIENGPISQSLTWSKDLTGAMFARPLEPSVKKG